MITISLQGAEFFAFHGFYPEEQLLGSRFMVDVEVAFTPLKDLKEDKIGNTVDYEQLYKIVDVQMKQTRKLIETVAQAIADDIKRRFGFVDSIRVIIKKLNPPLCGKVHCSVIEVKI